MYFYFWKEVIPQFLIVALQLNVANEILLYVPLR